MLFYGYSQKEGGWLERFDHPEIEKVGVVKQ